MCSELAQRIAPGSSTPGRMASHPTSQGPSGSTGSALAVLVRAPAPPPASTAHPCPGVTGTTIPGQTCQLGIGFVFLEVLARPALCSSLLPSPASPDRPLPTRANLAASCVGWKQVPPSSSEADPVNPFCCSGSKAPALRRGHEAEQLPGPTAAGLCLPRPPRADGNEARKETAFLLNNNKKKQLCRERKTHPVFSPPPSSLAWMGGTVWMNGTAWLSRSCPSRVGTHPAAPTLPAPCAPGGWESPKHHLRPPHMALWWQRVPSAPLTWGCSSQSSSPEYIHACRRAGAVGKALGFPLYIAFPTIFASHRD